MKLSKPGDVFDRSRFARSPTMTAPFVSADSSANANTNFGFGQLGAIARANAESNASNLGSSASASSSSSSFLHQNFFPGQFGGSNQAYLDAHAKANAEIEV